VYEIAQGYHVFLPLDDQKKNVVIGGKNMLLWENSMLLWGKKYVVMRKNMLSWE